MFQVRHALLSDITLLARCLDAAHCHVGSRLAGNAATATKTSFNNRSDKQSVKRLLILPKTIAPVFSPLILGVLGETINATQVVKACLMSRPAVSRQWEISLCSNYCGRFPMSTKASGSHFESDLVSHSAITASIIAFLSHT